MHQFPGTPCTGLSALTLGIARYNTSTIRTQKGKGHLTSHPLSSQTPFTSQSRYLRGNLVSSNGSAQVKLNPFLPNVSRTIHWPMQGKAFVKATQLLQSIYYSKAVFFHTNSNFRKSSHMGFFLLAHCWPQFLPPQWNAPLQKGPRLELTL